MYLQLRHGSWIPRSTPVSPSAHPLSGAVCVDVDAFHVRSWAKAFALVQAQYRQCTAPVHLDERGLPPAEVVYEEMRELTRSAGCEAIVLVSICDAAQSEKAGCMG